MCAGGIQLFNNFREEIRSEIFGPVASFDSMRSRTAMEWYSSDLSAETFDDADANNNFNQKERKIHRPRRYHYVIGNYDESTYYKKFLAEDNIRVPGGMTTTVRLQAATLSLDPKSEFRSWFRMPLYKVDNLVERFISEGWVYLSRHCRSDEQLKKRTELMILGSLAVLAGTVQSFRQLPILTNICATEHSYFFLTFVDRLESISGEYIFHPRDEEEVKQTMARYEEVGLPGAVGSVDVVHIKWSNCPAGHHN